MVQFKAENGRATGICSGTGIKITTESVMIALLLYDSLLKTDESCARMYIGILKAFVNDPDRVLAEFKEEE